MGGGVGSVDIGVLAVDGGVGSVDIGVLTVDGGVGTADIGVVEGGVVADIGGTAGVGAVDTGVGTEDGSSLPLRNACASARVRNFLKRALLKPSTWGLHCHRQAETVNHDA